jgi:hypothetical protein
MHIREKTKESIQLGRFHRASDPFIDSQRLGGLPDNGPANPFVHRD